MQTEHFDVKPSPTRVDKISDTVFQSEPNASS